MTVLETTDFDLTEGASRAGKTRSHFMTHYVKTGKVSVDRSDPKNPKVSASEIIRVFGKLHDPKTKQKHQNTTEQFVDSIKIEHLQELLNLAREENRKTNELLAEYQKRLSDTEHRFDRLLESRLQKVEPKIEPIQKFKQFITQLFR
jgi:hypothetical protein